MSGIGTQTDRQTGSVRQTDIQTMSVSDGRTDRHTDQTDRQVGSVRQWQTNKQTGSVSDGRTDRHRDIHTDRQTHKQAVSGKQVDRQCQ